MKERTFERLTVRSLLLERTASCALLRPVWCSERGGGGEDERRAAVSELLCRPSVRWSASSGFLHAECSRLLKAGQEDVQPI